LFTPENNPLPVFFLAPPSAGLLNLGLFRYGLDIGGLNPSASGIILLSLALGESNPPKIGNHAILSEIKNLLVPLRSELLPTYKKYTK
jgi:hypothetical protein